MKNSFIESLLDARSMYPDPHYDESHLAIDRHMNPYRNQHLPDVIDEVWDGLTTRISQYDETGFLEGYDADIRLMRALFPKGRYGVMHTQHDEE